MLNPGVLRPVLCPVFFGFFWSKLGRQGLLSEPSTGLSSRRGSHGPGALPSLAVGSPPTSPTSPTDPASPTDPTDPTDRLGGLRFMTPDGAAAHRCGNFHKKPPQKKHRFGSFRTRTLRDTVPHATYDIPS